MPECSAINSNWAVVTVGIYVITVALLFLTRNLKQRWIFQIIGLYSLAMLLYLPPFFIWQNVDRTQWDVCRLLATTFMLYSNFKIGELILDAKQYCIRHNITTLFQSIMGILLPCQIYFQFDHSNYRSQKKNQSQSSLFKLNRYRHINSRHNAMTQLMIGIVGIVAQFVAVNLIAIPYRNIIFDSNNLLSHIYQSLFFIFFPLSFGSSLVANGIPALVALYYGDRITVVYPYDLIGLFTMKCPRSFWKNWSRPVGESLRQLCYIPMGGRLNPILSVTSVFVTNCIAHFWYSWLAHGYWAVQRWIVCFAIMGVSVCAQIIFEKHWQTNMVWKVFWFVTAWLSAVTSICVVFGRGFMVDWDLYIAEYQL